MMCHSERSEESGNIKYCNQILRVAQDDTMIGFGMPSFILYPNVT